MNAVIAHMDYAGTGRMLIYLVGDRADFARLRSRRPSTVYAAREYRGATSSIHSSSRRRDILQRQKITLPTSCSRSARVVIKEQNTFIGTGQGEGCSRTDRSPVEYEAQETLQVNCFPIWRCSSIDSPTKITSRSLCRYKRMKDIRSNTGRSASPAWVSHQLEHDSHPAAKYSGASFYVRAA